MANKKVQRKVKSAQAPLNAGSYWLAAVGALSLARKRSAAALGELVAEGQRLQAGAEKVVQEARADAMAQIAGIVTPVKARLKQQVERAGSSLESALAAIRSRLGIPSKADVDELAQRVGTLSRQLKAVK